MSLKHTISLAVSALALCTTASPLNLAPRNSDPHDPYYNVTAPGLPQNTYQVVSFGERPAWSPDGSRVAFMSKSYGDGYELDLKSRRLRIVTAKQNAGFLRIQYLPNGDYFLIGAQSFTEFEWTREHEMEMWIQPAESTEPVRLDHLIWEGVAISTQQPKIAWANSFAQYPDEFKEDEYVIYIADIDYSSGKPVLANKREVRRSMAPDCLLEPQDFRNNDTELIYTCYNPLEDGKVSGSVEGINLETGEITIYRDNADEYSEAEGIWPDGKSILVESGRGSKTETAGTSDIDLWRLNIETPGSDDFTRLTWFGDVEGWKCGNPVVSPDGKTVAFQESRTGDSPGMGYGIYLLDIEDQGEICQG